MSEQVYYLIVVVAAAAVSSSLMYVGIQIKRLAAKDAANVSPDVMQELRELYARMAQDEALANIFRDAMHENETTCVADKFRFTLIAHNFFRLFEEAYYQKAAGDLAKKDWHGITEQFIFLKDLPGFKAFWKDRKFLFSSDFCNFYDTEILPVQAHTKFDYQ